MDRDTDALIQAALRVAAAGGGAGSGRGGSFRCRGGGRRRTLLVIAHRIDTIMVRAPSPRPARRCLWAREHALFGAGGELPAAGRPRLVAAP